VPGLPCIRRSPRFPDRCAADAEVPTPPHRVFLGDDASICAPSSMRRRWTRTLRWAQGQRARKPLSSLHKANRVLLAGTSTLWLPAQQVMLVMGKGPIPSFRTVPYLPFSRPRVGGDNHPAPVHLMA